MVQWALSPSYLQVPAGVLAALLPVQLPAKVPGRAVRDGFMGETQIKLLASA